MSKTKISQYDADPANNTDIDGINLAEGMAPGLVNNAIREMMAQLKDFQQGTVGDNLTVGGNLTVTGTASIGSNTIDSFPSGTKMLFQQSAAPTGWTKDTTHNNKALRVVTGTTSSGGSVGFTTAFASKAISGTISNTTATGTVGGTSLTTAQIPSHNHTGTTGTTSINHSHSFSGSGNTSQAGGHSHSGSTDTANLVGDFWVGGFNAGQGGIVSRIAVGGRPGLDNASGQQELYRVNATHSHSLSINAVGNHFHPFAVSGTTGASNPAHSHTFTTSFVGSGSSHNHSFTGTAHNHVFSGDSVDLDVQYVDIIICTKS